MRLHLVYYQRQCFPVWCGVLVRVYSGLSCVLIGVSVSSKCGFGCSVVGSAIACSGALLVGLYTYSTGVSW